jgi:hypothetical protein
MVRGKEDLLDTGQEIRFMEISNIYEIKLTISSLSDLVNTAEGREDMDILYDQEQPPSSNRHHNTCLQLCSPVQSMSGSDR